MQSVASTCAQFEMANSSSSLTVQAISAAVAGALSPLLQTQSQQQQSTTPSVAAAATPTSDRSGLYPIFSCLAALYSVLVGRIKYCHLI